MSSKIFDDFQEMFHDESEFIDSIRDMENNSEWLPEIPRKELQVIPLDGPMFVADAVAKYGVDHDIQRIHLQIWMQKEPSASPCSPQR